MLDLAIRWARARVGIALLDASNRLFVVGGRLLFFGPTPAIGAHLVLLSRRLWVEGTVCLHGDREQRVREEQANFDRFYHRLRLVSAGLTEPK